MQLECACIHAASSGLKTEDMRVEAHKETQREREREREEMRISGGRPPQIAMHQ
jgi:hypothetical protein